MTEELYGNNTANAIQALLADMCSEIIADYKKCDAKKIMNIYCGRKADKYEKHAFLLKNTDMPQRNKKRKRGCRSGNQVKRRREVQIFTNGGGIVCDQSLPVRSTTLSRPSSSSRPPLTTSSNNADTIPTVGEKLFAQLRSNITKVSTSAELFHTQDDTPPSQCIITASSYSGSSKKTRSQNTRIRRKLHSLLTGKVKKKLHSTMDSANVSLSVNEAQSRPVDRSSGGVYHFERDLISAAVSHPEFTLPGSLRFL